MSELVLYKDKSEIFECEIKITGSSIDKSKARLVLYFNENNDIPVIISGKINENGIFNAKIPPLKNISSKEGKLHLEVITENMFFEPLQKEFELKNNVSVSVMEAKIKDETPEVKVTINEKQKEDKIDNNMNKIFKESMSKENKKIVLDGYSFMKKLNEEKLKNVNKSLSIYKPDSRTEKWLKEVLVEHDGQLDDRLKILAYYYEKVYSIK